MSDISGQPHALAASLHTRITDDENLRVAIGRVADAARRLLINCSAASVTLFERGQPMTAGSTSDVALALDQSQYDASAGPCLTAAIEDRVLLIADIGDVPDAGRGDVDERWPEFRRAALEHGVRSSLSTPLSLGSDAAGGLNMYAQVAGAFSDEDVRVATAFAAQASVVVANAQAYWSTLEAIRNLTVALDSRAVIEQAKGVLIARHGLSDDEAFAELRRRSQEANRKLREIATDVVEQARREAGGPT